MPNFQPITRELHTGKYWRRYPDHAHLAAERVTPLVAPELPRAAAHLPIAFLKNNETFFPFAVLSIPPGGNLFVAPDGRWLGGYIPAGFRLAQFRLVHSENRPVLCVDVDSGLITDSPADEAFFAADGNPAKETGEVFKFLSMLDQGRTITVAACAALQAADLIVPWEITLKHPDGQEHKPAGLYRIDEDRLGRLPDNEFLKLRQHDALTVAHCQLVSMQHYVRLVQLAERHHQHISRPAPAEPQKRDLDLEFLSKGETINFGHLGK